MANATIAVIDSGGGNIGSLLGALHRRSADVTLVADPAALGRAQAAILPGDGAFAATRDALAATGFADALREHITAGKALLGICVGMQVLFESSDEHDAGAGFGILPGHVRRFARAPRLPHMGWNDLRVEREHPFVAGLGDGAYAYFLHSYRVLDAADALATAEYGERFAAIVARDNVVATQFHPEKSARSGGLLLDNFLRLAAA